MIVIWQHCLLKWKLSLKVKENRKNLQKETSTYCRQTLLNATIPTNTIERGSTAIPVAGLYRTRGNSWKNEPSTPLFLTPSPICPNMAQIKQVTTH
jgi:hypothetical protein